MQLVRVRRTKATGEVVVTDFFERPLLRRLSEQRSAENEIRDQQRLVEQLARRGN